MFKSTKSMIAMLVAAPLTLAGCAQQEHIVTLAPPPPALPARPTPPEGAFAALALPPQGPDGAYVTPNQGLGPQGAIWHVRAALNVAALRCPDEIARPIAVRYNALLQTQKTTFSKAYTAVRALYRKSDPKGWETSFDQDMTRLYNFYAQSGGKSAFCSTASDISMQAAAVKPTDFQTFAQTALPTLDQPFTAFYAAYAQYEQAAAAWDKQYGTPAPVAPPTVATTPTTKPVTTASIN